MVTAVSLLAAAAAMLIWPEPARWIGLIRRARPAGDQRWVPWRSARGPGRPIRLIRGSRAALAAACLAAAGLGSLVSWPCALAAALVAATVGRLMRRAGAAAADRADLAGLTDALHALARDLQSGTPAPQALTHAVESASPRIAALLAELPGALLGSAPARASPPSRVLAALWPRLRAGWELSLVYGVPLAAVVSALAGDVADRMRAAESRAAQVAGPAVSGYVLSALPVAGLLLGVGMGTDPLAVLTGSALGGGLLIAGTLLCCVGLLWADRLVRG